MQQRGITPLEAVDQFLLDCAARRLTPQTQKFYRLKLAKFTAWLEAQRVTDVVDITPRHLRAFFAHLADQGLSATYSHNIGRAVHRWLEFLVADDLLARSPMRNVALPRLPKEQLPSLTDGEIKRVLASCSCERDKALVLLLLDSGLRASEACALDVASIDFGNGAVLVKQGKGQKDRTAYIGARTRRQLHRYLRGRRPLDPAAPLIASLRGQQRLTGSGLAQIMGRLQQASGVVHCTCHGLRRSFALGCLRNGMNIYALAALMGHQDITVLVKYLRLVESDRQQAAAKHGVVDNL